MRITLKPNAELPNKGPYNNSAKDRAFIDETFNRYHAQGKMDWAPQGVQAAWPAFVVWQKLKGRVVIDIRGLNGAVWKDPYPMPRQEDILQAIKHSSVDTTGSIPPILHSLHSTTIHPSTLHCVRSPETRSPATRSPSTFTAFAHQQPNPPAPLLSSFTVSLCSSSLMFRPLAAPGGRFK
jgi:hypothetical protein